jgi:hypothetical protein
MSKQPISFIEPSSEDSDIEAVSAKYASSAVQQSDIPECPRSETSSLPSISELDLDEFVNLPVRQPRARGWCAWLKTKIFGALKFVKTFFDFSKKNSLDKNSYFAYTD